VSARHPARTYGTRSLIGWPTRCHRLAVGRDDRRFRRPPRALTRGIPKAVGTRPGARLPIRRGNGSGWRISGDDRRRRRPVDRPCPPEGPSYPPDPTETDLANAARRGIRGIGGTGKRHVRPLPPLEPASRSGNDWRSRSWAKKFHLADFAPLFWRLRGDSDRTRAKSPVNRRETAQRAGVTASRWHGGHIIPFHSVETRTASTRRFRARPSSVRLLARGARKPTPSEEI